MDEQGAKYILNAGHPRGQDAGQEAFREAMDLAGKDPEVSGWVNRQQRLTDSLRTKLNEVPVPAGLKDRILAGAAVSRTPRHWSRSSLLMMAAAFVVLLFVLAWQFFPRSSSGEKSFAGLRQDMAEFLSGYFGLELQSNQLGKLQSHLATEHQFVRYTVPRQLAGKTSVGCRVIDWHGSHVALICFTVNRELVHLMVLPKDELLELPDGIHPVQQGEWATTGWQDDNNVYLVATRGSPAFLANLMSE